MAIFYNTKLPRWDVSDLKPGDKVFIARQTMLGWRAFRYNTYQEYTVVRITPKKTKIYVTDGNSELEFVVSKTDFFKDSPELQAQHHIATCAASCNTLLFQLDKRKDCMYRMSDDEFTELHEHLSGALKLMEKYDQAQ